ncbi:MULTISPECIES: methylated-DNA--[protein]-cysteine S-methyltransferase [Acinetobacter]|uniref:methylated-DNA--[protein]-cysteine S-methyltransferase n=2 Tax=Acinetobacter nosocomialis TaxID=106654 RepID=A0AA36NTC9_ACINO|nr:methylated-DNA-[protein]-cysteine S-methyltransferase [Acinetobacter sp. RUH 2624]EKF47243.1 methylated-DNA-[protein]-cysteine S-methyltransferase [Acinetobacter nosocomialis Ab22222]EXE99801.1 methylated-DNA-[]-cysteine S-methyltransferase family protein [Acinetobacter sp. 259052]EXS45848.1 methylated-DNA-[]-cysteine S-methyltransferase family protein [Acinetobacter sp. 88816]EXT39065.1 methylated-DNA-[]-cysteine S-methyltransferase family protein [Acinetobacter sp. 25977_8]EXT42369.1 meth
MQMLSSRQFAVIATIIEYLYEHLDQQPSLEDVAKYMDLSPSYIQRQFQEWVGISPKKFVQYMSLQQAKYYLMQQRSLLDTALNTGLSGTGRLHDLFIQLEGMTPGEYKQQGDGVELNYSVETSPFGDLLVVSSEKGICSVRFVDSRENIQDIIKQYFPKAQLRNHSPIWHQQIAQWFRQDFSEHLQQKLPLNLAGTPFQLQVWEALLTIPEGQLRTYQDIAEQIGKPKAVRAVATAIGQNPIAYLIPCHRVIRATGMVGEYHWQKGRKLALLAWEMAKQQGEIA